MKNFLYRILLLGSRTYYIKNIKSYIYLSWKKCNFCGSMLFYKKVIKNYNICYKCGFHFNISARNRANLLFKSRYIELYNFILPFDILNFFDTKHYYSRLVTAQIRTKELEALLLFKGKIMHFDVIICIFEFNFIGGSMGKVVGEKFKMAVDFSIKYKLPIICFSSSGGVRMQESVIALLQMSKVSFAVSILGKYKIPYLSVIINPCMGGVSASLAMLGDIIMAEPYSMIGFAGPRVIKNTTGHTIPDNFQNSESLLKNGFLDFTVDRKKINSKILNILKILINI